MDPEPGRCRRADGKKWRCGKDVIPDQKYSERHMHRGRGHSRNLVEASEISLESVPVNLELGNSSPKSNSNNSIGKAHTSSSISSVSGSENRVYAKKESTATATASPTINGIDKESNKNVYHSKDTMRPMTTTGLWTAGSDQINKCTSNSNSSIGNAPATSAISSICGSGNKIYAKNDPSAAATATPTTNNVDKESDKSTYHSKDTTRSTTTGGPWRAGFEKIDKCTSGSECVDGKDAACKHLNNITIGQSKNYIHVSTAGYGTAGYRRLGFSPDTVLQGCCSSCLKYRNDVEPELQRCGTTDGKKWYCGTDVVPNQKYCERHLHRGAKKPLVAEPVEVALAPLPYDICRVSVTPLAIPKKGSGYINLNSNLSLSIAASPQQMANKEKGNTSSSSDADSICDDNDNRSVRNDVPSGESIFYNNRDYTPEFNTDQVFKSRDAMLDWVRKIGLENGIVVVIKKSANLKGGKGPKCILGCERGGQYKSHRKHVEGQSMQRNTRTKKCDCPFKLRGIPIPPNYVMWGLSVSCGFHNHEPAEYLDGHEYLNNITIGQSKNYRHPGTAGSPVASRLGFSLDSALQGFSSSCLKYRNDVEPELQRCRRTDGKKWRCGTDVVPNEKYCERHLHRGAKKPLVAEPVKVAWAPLPSDFFRVTPLAIPKKGSGDINLNSDLSLSIAASPQQMANKEKGNTSSSSSDADSISGDNDSWSVQNDVPSGKSVSFNTRDYTLEFNTDQVFENRDAMLVWVRKTGFENGIVVVIKKSANQRGGKRPKCILSCERGGKYKPPRNHVEGQLMQRNTGTRKCNCPFELRGIPIPPNYVMWGLRVVCGFHNHKPIEYLDGHEVPSRLKPVKK